MHQREAERQTLREAMGFLGALASGIEEAVGDPARSVAYAAGKKLGHRFSEQAARTDDLPAALEELRRVLAANQCHWAFEAFKPSDRPSLVVEQAEGDEILLVFRDCMIRQSLFLFGHQQRGSLCNLMFGFFAGALEQIMGRASTLEIVHAGENACLKRLSVRRA